MSGVLMRGRLKLEFSEEGGGRLGVEWVDSCGLSLLMDFGSPEVPLRLSKVEVDMTSVKGRTECLKQEHNVTSRATRRSQEAHVDFLRIETKKDVRLVEFRTATYERRIDAIKYKVLSNGQRRCPECHESKLGKPIGKLTDRGVKRRK
jgi:hypothetical protein